MMEWLVIGGEEGGAARGRDGLSRGGHASFVGGDEALNTSLNFSATIFGLVVMKAFGLNL